MKHVQTERTCRLREQAVFLSQGASSAIVENAQGNAAVLGRPGAFCGALGFRMGPLGSREGSEVWRRFEGLPGPRRLLGSMGASPSGKEGSCPRKQQRLRSRTEALENAWSGGRRPLAPCRLYPLMSACREVTKLDMLRQHMNSVMTMITTPAMLANAWFFHSPRSLPLAQ